MAELDQKTKLQLERESLNVINFTNIDSEPFEGMWGGQVEVIEAGETRPFPKFLAYHYTKHLVNHLLIKQGQSWTDKKLREPLEKQCLGEVETEEVEEKPKVKKAKEEKPEEKAEEIKPEETEEEFDEQPEEKPKKKKSKK